MFARTKPRFTAIVFALLTCAAMFLCACTSVGPVIDSLAPYYDLDGFSQENFRVIHTNESGTASKTGVDVSENQGWIDWDAVASDGIEFAFIRAGYRGTTEGQLFEDEFFRYNLEAARNAGIECGVYFFSQAISVDEAREEAMYVLSLIDGVPLEYPVVFDHEDMVNGVETRAASISPEEASAIATVFCGFVESSGYSSMIYGNPYDLSRYDLDALDEYPLWYAKYHSLPAYSREFAIWQYSNEGSVYGIDTVVDLNLDLTVRE